MKLKLDYRRRGGDSIDVIVTTDAATSIGEVAAELLLADPRSPTMPEGLLTLAVAPPGSEDFSQLDPSRELGESSIASGRSVRVEPYLNGQADEGHRPLVEVSVLDGPGMAVSRRLPAGSYVIGRDQACDLVLEDTLVSRRHARLDAGAVVELVDLKSANGIEVDSGRVERLRVTASQQVVLGDTTLLITALAQNSLHGDNVLAGAAMFNRSPRVEARYAGAQYPAPDVPTEADKPPFPWGMMIVPILMGAVSFVVSNGNPTSFVFVGMSPLMMLANYVTSRKRSVRQRDTQIGTFEEQISDLASKLSDATERERAVRCSEAPSAAEVAAAVLTRSALMWTRRPEHWNFLAVRFGLGAAPSRNSIAPRLGLSRGIERYARRLDDLIAQHHEISGVPITENPIESGALGVVGPRDLAAGVVRSMLIQWTGLHSPAELIVAAMVAPSEAMEYDWLKWLPHVSSPLSPITVSHLADSPTSARDLLLQLEELVSTRNPSAASLVSRPSSKGEEPVAMASGGRVGESEPAALPNPVVVLVVSAAAPVDRSRLIQLSESAVDAGVIIVHLGESPIDLPGSCRTFAAVAEREVSFVRHGLTVSAVELESMTIGDAERCALAMSPCVDQGAADDATDLPRVVPLLSLLGEDVTATATAVVDRWRETESLVSDPPEPREKSSGLRARVGSAGATDMTLDLRAEGPHAFVGGSTGSGKSEFLQSWILGLATEYSPQRVTFLFVDYKASSAFEECVKLPHCVGLVTDLTPHLVSRALTSLRAELRTRQTILLEKKATDLLDLEKRGDPECPPALVIVIDEFAALVSEVPDFVDGVVDIAQRGRALGIHLVMATQRTAGVIKDSIRANANLRVCLRMTEEADSVDVLGSPVAATFDPRVPGRGMAKTGPGRLVAFQSAFAGGTSDTGPRVPDISIAELRFGTEQLWRRPLDSRRDRNAERGPTDLVRLVATITEAASLARVPKPRRPWLEELRKRYNAAAFGTFTDAELFLGIADMPEKQIQDSAVFRPDSDGHLIVYGTGGSGKTVLLRTLAAGAGVTTKGGALQVYCLDFASGGLRMLEVLPHVGAVIQGDDDDRVSRLFRHFKDELERRKRSYPPNVDSIVAYRARGQADEPRLLLLLDGYPAFREEYEGVSTRALSYATFMQILAEGRRFGIHVALTADRPGSVPSAVTANIPRRVVLRMSDDTMYGALDVPKGMLSADSPPGRSAIDGFETQIAAPGGSSNVAEQESAITGLATALADSGRVRASAIELLPTVIHPSLLPSEVSGEPVLGVADTTLGPTGFSVEGPMLLAGPPGSGRSSAVEALTNAVARWRPTTHRYYLSVRRSELASRADWSDAAVGPAKVAGLAREITESVDYVDGSHPLLLVVIEAIGDLLGTEAETPTLELVRTLRRTGHLLVAEAETSAWTGSWGAALLNEIKAARRGLLLQPDQQDGDTLVRTQLPRIGRDEYPPGRGLYVNRGRCLKVQLPYAG